MRTLVGIAVIAAIAIAGLLVRRRWTTRTPVADGTMAIRNGVLSRELFEDASPGSPGAIRAVLYDWDVGTGVATLISFDDDTTSLYLSSGGGVIGAGAHESVRQAAQAFREEAARALTYFRPAETFSLPSGGKSRFYIVTDSATLESGTFSNAEMRITGHPLEALVARAQQVIATVRQAG